MKNLLFLSLLGLFYLQPFVEALFFGPVAVGLGIGLLAFGKGLFLGSALSRRRSRHRRHKRSYYYSKPKPTYYNTGYSHNYNTGYNSYYSQPNKYYYTSTHKQTYSNYGRRNRYGRAVNDEISANSITVNETEWYEDMSKMDQDDCGKRMICELRAKERDGVVLGEEERYIVNRFGSGSQVDISRVEVEFELAAQIGKNMGIDRCGVMYSRCDTDVTVIIEMIKSENAVIENLDLSVSELDAILKKEEDEEEKEIDDFIKEELREKGINPALVWS